MSDPLRARIQGQLDRHCPPEDLPEALGVAVSGGSDSLALLHLCADWGADRDVPVVAVTIDHGLRPESAGEADLVKRICAGLAVEHTTLKWRGWSGQGNLQNAARQARRALIADWALAEGVDAVALGHTRDDQAETVLMNLARGSGVDGMAGMPAATEVNDLLWIRPLLTSGRAELQDYLTERDVTWVNDPSNDDTTFTRVKARKALTTLEDLGLSVDRLAAMADRMQDAREVLTLRAYELGGEVTWRDGDLILPLRTFRAAPRDTRNRTLAALLQTLSGHEHRPRFQALSDLSDALARQGQGGTLHGCLVTVENGATKAPDGTITEGPEKGPIIRLAREHAAVADLTTRPGEIWDNRWCLDATDPSLSVRALGQAAMGPLPEPDRAPLPRTSLMASPALWSGETLIAAPLAGLPGPANLNVNCRNLLARRDPLAALRSG